MYGAVSIDTRISKMFLIKVCRPAQQAVEECRVTIVGEHIRFVHIPSFETILHISNKKSLSALFSFDVQQPYFKKKIYQVLEVIMYMIIPNGDIHQFSLTRQLHIRQFTKGPHKYEELESDIVQQARTMDTTRRRV